jgi:hypothetical protein
LLVWADEAGEPQTGLHASFKLNVSGERLFLTDSQGILIDSLSFSRQYRREGFLPEMNMKVL